MKNILLLVAAAAASMASPAAATDFRIGTEATALNNTPNLSINLDASDFRSNTLGFGVNARSDLEKYGADELTGRIGYTFAADRFSVTPNLQAGVANINNDGRSIFATAGVGVDGRVELVDRVAAVGSYTYRRAVSDNDRYRLNEFTAGAEYRVSPMTAVDARFFKRTGSIDSQGVAAGVTFKL